MYELNKSSLCLLSGGYSISRSIYVTEEWKNDAALYAGLLNGLVGMMVGGILGGLHALTPFVGICFGSTMGGIIGFGLGLVSSRFETYSLENESYYEVTINNTFLKQ